MKIKYLQPARKKKKLATCWLRQQNWQQIDELDRNQTPDGE